MTRRRQSCQPALAVLLVLAGRAGAMDVTGCGQVVPAHDVGVLQIDLDCNGAARTCTYYANIPCSSDADCNQTGPGLCASQAVILGAGATLELNGHSIVADGAGGLGVWCAHPRFNVPCTIHGPGEISGGSIGVGAYRIVIADVDVHDTNQGIVAPTLVRATNVTADHNGLLGLYAGRLEATNVSASNNTDAGIFAPRLRGMGITASNNGGPGLIVYRRFKITGLVADNNGGGGIYSTGGGVLSDSMLSGNLYEGASLDLLTARLPHLRNTTCGKSAQLDESGEPGPSWGVCSGD